MMVPRFNATGRFDPVNLFRPASIAVIGADTQAGGEILANLAMGGFQGDVHVVRNMAELPDNTALTVLAVPAEQISSAMTDLSRKKCFAAIVPGPAPGLAADSARSGVRALGPHSFGLAVPHLNLNASRAHIAPPAGRLALISQSAALSRAVIDWAAPNGVGFSHIVGLGGSADIGFSSTLDWLSRDANTGAILLDIRRIKDRRQFLSAARAGARLRPVVAIHAGLRLRDTDGAAVRAFEAALRRAGVLCVDRLEDLLAAAETLSRARPLARDTIAIVSNGIGPARLAADTVLRNGLCLLTDDALDHDTLHVASADLAAAAHRLAKRTDLGGVLVVHAPQGAADEAAIASLCAKCPDQHAALLVCAMGETTGAPHRATLAHFGLPVFATPAQAIDGFAHLVRDHRNREAARELPASTVLALVPDRAWVRRVFAHARAAGHMALTQDEALDVLGAYGIPTVPTRRVAAPADAASAARMLGFPIVVKPRETTPPAERALCGLIFDLHDMDAVVAAARRLAARQDDQSELLVQRQVGRAREMAISMADDAMFGPIITFGAGGTVASAIDKAADLPPLNLTLARALIQRSATGALLSQPLRDRPAADAGAVAETLVRMSQLVVDFPEIAALDVPSLFVDQAGVLAADAWLLLRGPDEPPAAMAIAPYPAELIEHALIGAESMTIRPIRPEDAAAHGAFFARLSPQDIRYRFFSAVRALSPEQMARLTQVDYDREMAFIAVRDADADTVGVARLVCEADTASGEFAVIVQADMKGRGLASRLMRRLIDWARTRGVKQIVGQVLADNPPMLAFVRHLGFSVKRMPEEPDVMEVRLAV
ncbi:GNAT family N-acetyltransferase [Rhodopila sp.]|uniref:bifunctional acetate--CoA ligase family protein/GNAT family N-acetyltransferase n=1 Tax=Rhodopila sp. TaxID=2480087 RepID=UPI003D11F273